MAFCEALREAMRQEPIAFFRGGELATLSDFAGGGHHLDLILAGALKLSVEAAEVHITSLATGDDGYRGSAGSETSWTFGPNSCSPTALPPGREK